MAFVLTHPSSAALCAMATVNWPLGAQALAELVLRFIGRDYVVGPLLRALGVGLCDAQRTGSVPITLRADLEACIAADADDCWRRTAGILIDLYLLMCRYFVDGNAEIVHAIAQARDNHVGAFNDYVAHLVPLGALLLPVVSPAA